MTIWVDENGVWEMSISGIVDNFTNEFSTKGAVKADWPLA
jgi:hypothetical protein